MSNVFVKMDEMGYGSFYSGPGQVRSGEMQVCLADNILTVLSTRISGGKRDTSTGTQLLSALVDYARQHELKVVTLSDFARTQFKKHPELYADLWER